MLQITVEVFSGRPDPTWMVTDEAEARRLVRALAREAPLMAAAPPEDAPLGLRGVRLDATSDEFGGDLPADAVFLSLGPGASPRALELGERLFATMGSGTATVAESEGGLPLGAELMEFLSAQLGGAAASGRVTTADRRDGMAEEAGVASGGEQAAATCQIELGTFNPGFWNNNASLRSRNNCYNYASNRRTDSFAQPGRGAGQMYQAITCPEMTRASRADGLRPRFNCFPPNEAPRYLAALVAAPGPGFVDFHWYRKQREGFWGHKPGGTNARNTDNSNRVIMDPERCDRGPYRQFCGYFYTCRSQRIR